MPWEKCSSPALQQGTLSHNSESIDHSAFLIGTSKNVPLMGKVSRINEEHIRPSAAATGRARKVQNS